MTVPGSDRPSRSPLLCHGRRGAVQSEFAPRAPTPWTSRYARRPAATVTACSPSARRVIAAMRTARRAAGRPVVAARCGRPGRDISRVPRAVSTIATSSARDFLPCRLPGRRRRRADRGEGRGVGSHDGSMVPAPEPPPVPPTGSGLRRSVERAPPTVVGSDTRPPSAEACPRQPSRRPPP